MTKERKDWIEWQSILYCAQANKSGEDIIVIMEQTKLNIEKMEKEEKEMDTLEQSFL